MCRCCWRGGRAVHEWGHEYANAEVGELASALPTPGCYATPRNDGVRLA